MILGSLIDPACRHELGFFHGEMAVIARAGDAYM